jgi:hypothetical protein
MPRTPGPRRRLQAPVAAPTGSPRGPRRRWPGIKSGPLDLGAGGAVVGEPAPLGGCRCDGGGGVGEPRGSQARHQPESGCFPTDPPTRYPPRHEHTTTISGRASNDPRQHARQRRAVARRVLLASLGRREQRRECVASLRCQGQLSNGIAVDKVPHDHRGHGR